MNLELVERIVNAVLYEGYILYPYRPSAMKNHQRRDFSALVPQSYSQAQQGYELIILVDAARRPGDDVE